jgi:acetate CoA/acetoacetate CoA-transferase alpha subunit
LTRINVVGKVRRTVVPATGVPATGCAADRNCGRSSGREWRLKTAIRCDAAAELIPDGATLLVGGFMGVGSPLRLIDAILARGTRDLTVVCNDLCTPDRGVGKLVVSGQVRRAIVSHIGLNPVAQQQMLAGALEVELVPQGTLVERIRAGGVGLGGVLTATGIGTLVEEGKQIVEVDGRRFLLEKPIRGDFALIACHHADYAGNLAYVLTAHNFNPVMALAGATVIAEVEHFVPIGMISPDAVKTPGVLVDYLVGRAA